MILPAQNIADDCIVAFDENTILITDCDEDYPGPFAVGLTIHFLYKSDGTGGAPQNVVPDILKKLEDAFSPHGIYFVLKCVNTIEDSFLYDSANDNFLNGSSYMNETTLNLIIKGTAAGGHAVLGGNYALSGTGAPTYNIIAHEIGHALGLRHTFHGYESNSSGQQEYVNGQDCCIRGDLVCDTPADPNINYLQPNSQGAGLQEDCSWVTPSQTDPNGDSFENVDVGNYMSYYRDCRNHFTEGQGARMRAHLVDDPSVNIMRRDEALISTDTEWLTDQYFDTDIRILPGNELRIEGATVYMAPGTRIIVDKGAVLKIRTSTVTVNPNATNTVCIQGPFWKGIELRGGDSSTEIPSITVIYDSVIEFAEDALYFPDQSVSSTHGRVTAARSHFRNNTRSLGFYKANTFSLLDRFYTWRFVRCNFYLNNEYPVNAPFIAHATIVNMNRALFDGCTFTVPQYGVHNNSQGLFAYASTVQIKSYCSSGYPENACPTEQYIQSQFSGFEQGIRLANAHGSEVKEVAFSNCFEGMTITGSNNVEIRGNQFNIPGFEITNRLGLLIDESTGYTIVDNIFNNVDPTLFQSNRGLTVRNSGSEPNIIANNTFNSLKQGINIEGINSSFNIQSIGLSLFCNEHNNSHPTNFGGGGPYDFIANFSTIASTQGGPSRPAGNKFSGHTDPNGSDFFKAGGIVQYYYYNADPVQNPVNSVGLDKIITNVDPDCGQYSSIVPSTPGDLTGVYDTYIITKTKLEGFIDGGNTDQLLQLVLHKASHQFSEVEAMLYAISPFVSEEVLAAVLQRADALTPLARKNLIKANPDQLTKGTLRQLIETDNNGLTAAMKQELLYGVRPTTPRTLLEKELYELALNSYPLANTSIKQIYQDTNRTDYATIRQHLSPRSSFSSSLQATETYMWEGDWSNYANAVSSLISSFSSTEGISDYETFANILMSLSTKDKGFRDLNTSSLNSLVSLGEQTTNGLIFQRIADFLWTFYGITIQQTNAIQQQPKEGQEALFQQVVTKQASIINTFKVFPNPANEYISIEPPSNISRNNPKQILEVLVVNALQQVIYTQDNFDTSSPLQITTNTWQEGLYYLLIKENGSPIFQHKIIIQK